MATPLSTAASIAGLIGLAQELVVSILHIIQNARSYPKEVKKIVEEVQSLCGVLCMIQPVVAQMETRNALNGHSLNGFARPSLR